MDDDLTFLATSCSTKCCQVLDKHLVGYWTLQFVEAGQVWVAYDDRSFTLNRPSFFPAYPGPRLRFHAAEPGGRWFHRHVGFQGPGVARWIAAGLWPTAPQDAPPNVDWGTRFDRLIELVRQSDRWSRLRAVNELEGILLCLGQAREQEISRSVDDPWLADALAALEKHDPFAPDYAAVASTLNCSVATLRRRFKTALGGQSLHEFVIGRRIARARRLLVETNLSIGQIAARLGYDSPYYFARQFRQIAGVTPGTYRKSRLFVPPSE